MLSQVSGWGTMYYLISASMSCTIQSSLGYCVPSQGMYWYILGQNSVLLWDIPSVLDYALSQIPSRGYYALS